MTKEVKTTETKLPRPVRNLFLIANPITPAPKSTIKLDEKQEFERTADWQKAQLKNIQKIKVVAVGPDVTSFKVGDEVKIKTSRVTHGEYIVDDTYILHSEADVIAVY